MKLLPRLTIVLVICLIAMALPPIPAQAQCGGPVIELSPTSGVPGTEVAVDGLFFNAGKYVDIYYDGTRVATDRTDSSGDFTISFITPESYTGAHIVQAVVSGGATHTHFTVRPGLAISPERGPVGTNVTVKGQGFANKEEGIKLMYYFSDSYETVERNIIANAQGSWEISFPIPQSINGEHKIDAEGTENKLHEVKDATFKVTPEINLDKSAGSVGESITMMGSRFMAYEKIQILFANQVVTTGIEANSQGGWEASFEVPELPTGTYSVTAEGEWTGKEDINVLSFEIKPDIVLSTTKGYVGMDLTVTSHGFAANEDVVIMYEDNEVATARTNAQGSFEVSFVVPESQSDRHQVIARDISGNNATAILTMESDAPETPELISPPDGSWVRLMGKVRPTFEWSVVSDESGVRYRLQIATSANVTPDGEFVNPIFSFADLVGTNYTLEEADALPHGTYYWIVQAVDGVENESGWTAARSFRAGLLPRWAFIAAIVAIVALIVALVRYLVRRRRYYYE